MISWIQRHALLVLIREPHASIKQMRPTDVAANLFSYHLKQLISDGYIEHRSRGTYYLTAKGHKFVGSFSTQTEGQVENIKTVVMLYARDSNNKLLLFHWSRQPYLGFVTLPHDRMIVGKPVDQALRDVLVEKCGLSADTPTVFLGNGLIKVTHEGEIISHMHAMVYCADIVSKPSEFIAKNGSAFWSEVNQIDSSKMMVGFDELVDILDMPITHPFDVCLTY